MTDEAVIQADYCDLKFIKTRKVAQVVLEIPIEQSDAFIAAFGSPRPDLTVPVVIARMNPEQMAKPKGGKLAQRAGILCNEGAFQQFVAERAGITASKDNAAAYLRGRCGVKSRSEIDHDEVAKHKLRNLETEYRAWCSVAA